MAEKKNKSKDTTTTPTTTTIDSNSNILFLYGLPKDQNTTPSWVAKLVNQHSRLELTEVPLIIKNDKNPFYTAKIKVNNAKDIDEIL